MIYTLNIDFNWSKVKIKESFYVFRCYFIDLRRSPFFLDGGGFKLESGGLLFLLFQVDFDIVSLHALIGRLIPG